MDGVRHGQIPGQRRESRCNHIWCWKGRRTWAGGASLSVNILGEIPNHCLVHGVHTLLGLPTGVGPFLVYREEARKLVQGSSRVQEGFGRSFVWGQLALKS